MLIHLVAALILGTVGQGSYQNEDHGDRSTKPQQMGFKKDDKVSGEDFPWKNVHLPRHIVPNSYHLKLQPFGEEGYFQGEVHINISCLETTNKIALHAHEDLQVNRESVSIQRLLKKDQRTLNVTQNDKRRDPELRISKVRRNFTSQQYRIILEKKLKKGAVYQVILAFTSNLSNDSNCAFCIKNYEDHNTENSSWFIVSHMKPGYARKVFPCFDELKYKASFMLSIARPTHLKSLSNMPVQINEEMTNHDGWIWDHFYKTPPMSTSSLVVLTFSPIFFQEVSPVSSKGSFSVTGFAQQHTVSNLQDKMEKVIHIINFLEEYLNRTFPLPQLNLVALPQTATDAVENYWGNILFDEAELCVQDLPWQLLYALTSQWVGHLVTPRQWSSIHASHALVEYLALISSKEAVNYSEHNNTMGWKQDDYYMLYNDFSKVSVSDPSRKLQSLKYTWFMSMLSHALTADTFQQAIRVFIDKWAFKTFKETNLWNTLSKQAWMDNSLETSISIENIVSSWVKRDRYPVVTVLRNYENNSALIEQEVFIRRWPFKIPDQESMLWWVPITYLSQEDLDISNISFITWMKEEREISIENMPEPSSFIIINPEDIGMFIVNYDSNNWNMLAEYLSASGANTEQSLIPPATRAKLLHNAWYLALGGRLDFTTALNMTLFLRTETEIPVWKALSQIYFTVSWKLAGTNAETKFDRFVGQMLIPIYDATGNSTLHDYHPKEEISALANYILCKAGYKQAVSRARKEFEEQLSETKEMDGGNIWAVFRWVDEEWESGLQRVIDLLHNETSPDFRTFLLSQLMSSIVQPDKLERLLKMLLIEEDYIFTDAELKVAFAATVDSKTFLNFLTNNWSPIKKRFGNRNELWQYMFEQATKKLKTQEGYDMVSEFYNAHKEELGDATQIVKHSLQIIRTNKDGTYRNIPSLETWLDHYLTSDETNHLFYSI